MEEVGVRLVADVAEEMTRTEMGGQTLSLIAGVEQANMWGSMTEIYKDYAGRMEEKLGASMRDLAPRVITMWLELLRIGMLNKRECVILPIPKKEFCRLFPGCRVVGDADSREVCMWAWPRWL